MARMGQANADGASRRAVLFGVAGCVLLGAVALVAWALDLSGNTGLLLVAVTGIAIVALLGSWAASALRAAERAARSAARDPDERAPREGEARERGVLASALDAIAVIDGDGRVVDFNAAAEATFGYTRIDAIGRRLGDLVVPPSQRAAHERGIARAREGGESRILGRRIELTAMRADGTEFPAEVSITRASAPGEPLLYTGFIRDLSERQEAEKARARSEELEALNHELTELTVKLDEVNRELESFSYSVSHDLRTPLRAIDGFSLVLLEDHSAALDPTGKEHLGRIRGAAQQMGALIDDLLRLANIARTEMQTEDVDLSELSRAIATELAAAHPQRVVDLSIADGMRARGDRGMLRVALANLLDNAWKFTGGRPSSRVEVGTARIDGERAYFVRDDGAGFDMQYAARLFTPFQRLHRADEFAGTGVGLATVERVVRRHGGRIWAESKVGEGATFFFTLRSDAADA
jgi:PAS domain S-box-containing protein